MKLRSIDDLQKTIKLEYGIEPDHYNDNVLRYRAISFKHNTNSIINASKDYEDTWTVQRDGHSIDFFKTSELEKAIDVGGSLLYYFMPEQRI